MYIFDSALFRALQKFLTAKVAKPTSVTVSFVVIVTLSRTL